MKGKPKHIILLSGGMDSAVAGCMVAESKGKALAISFDYGQRHKKELVYAEAFAKEMGWDWKVFQMPIGQFSNNALTNPKKSINKTYRCLPATFVPGRNLFFLTAAGAIAYSLRLTEVTGGWNVVDYGGYPDCREGFLTRTQYALRDAMNWMVEINRPVILMTKSEIVRIGAELKVPFGLTWSCYAGKDKPCGKCNSCINRAKGFEEAGVIDPLLMA